MGFWEYAIPGYNVYALGRDAQKSSNDRDAAIAGARGTDPQLNALISQAMNRANGQDSMAERTGQMMLGRGQSMQNSLLAGARPGTEGLAARTAGQQSSQLAATINQQTQIARLAEQMQNAGLAGNMLLGMRQGDMGLAQQAAAQPAGWERYLGMVGQGAQVASMASDRRLKTDVKDGDGAVRKTLKGLREFAYRYKDEKFGEGDQVGVMAQDLERTPIGKQVVRETPAGKMVDGVKLSGFNTAALVNLSRRIEELEGKAA